MIKALKIRLKPDKKQEILMFKSAGTARFTYNWGLARWEELYRQGLNPNKVSIKKEFNNTLKKDEQYRWLKEVSGQVTAQAFDDLNTAYMKFFNGTSKRPQFKSKKKSRTSFYVRYDAVKFVNNTVNIEKIGKVQYQYNKDIPDLRKYINPRCSFDGKYWYLSLGYGAENQAETLSDESIGIDVGVKDLAVCSNGMKFKNINKIRTVRKLKKKLKRLQRRVSGKYEKNKQEKKFVKTSNIKKLEKKIRLIHRRLANIRNNHLHQATNMIVKTKPSRVVMETLNLQGLMKNRHLAKAIQEQKLYEFKRQLQYKCNFKGIEFAEADKWYPSSKTCSKCNHIKKDLKLSERTYICEECGSTIDRDFNAAVNLSRYSA